MDSTPQTPLRRAWSYLQGRARLLLLGLTMENPVFRHEIRMDAFGRLRWGSPVIVVHALMGGWLFGELLAWAFLGWLAALWGCAAIMTLMILGMFPFAAARASSSITGDRESGRLEQLRLTPLAVGEFFEGKYFGLLAPLIEIRRYLMIGGIVFVWGIFELRPGPWPLAALVVWLTGMNHVGHSAVMGTLGGLKWGAMGDVRFVQYGRDWRFNPWPHHLWLSLQIAAILALPLAFLFWLGTKTDWTLYPAFSLMLLMPFYVAVRLTPMQHNYYTGLRSTFDMHMIVEGTRGRIRRVDFGSKAG